MRLRRGLAATALSLGLTGCISVTTDRQVSCPPGEDHRQVAELVLGRNIGQTLGVSEADFTRFLDEEVTPRFPDGLTVWDSQGRWLDKGVVWKEPGKTLTIVLPGKPDDRRKLDEIAQAYETRFRQDAVLTMVHGACVSFHLPKAAAKSGPAGG
jgi:hypothetical protein